MNHLEISQIPRTVGATARLRRHASTSSAASHPVQQLVRMPAVLDRLGLKARQTVYDLLRSDPTFPRPRRTGPHSIAWVQDELDAWIRALPVAELDGISAIERRQACAAARTA